MKRFLLIDSLRCYTIVLVVLGHVIQFGSGSVYTQSEVFYSNLLFKVIYSFHMPLFMLISGILFGKSAKHKTNSNLLKSRIMQLLIPVVFWNSMMYILDSLLNNNEEIILSIQGYVLSLFSGSWFIWSLIFSSITIIIVRKYFCDSIYFYILLIVASLFVPNYFMSNLHVFMFPYFVLGYKLGFHRSILETFEWIDAKDFFCNKKRLVVLLSVVAVYMLLLCCYQYDNYIYTSGTCILNGKWIEQLFINLHRWLIGLLGSFIFIIIVSIINYRIRHKVKYAIIMEIIGGNTFGIYMISSILNQFLKLISNNWFPALHVWIIEMTIILLVSIGITLLIKKSKFLNQILLGGR